MKTLIKLILLILERNQRNEYTAENARLIHDLGKLLQGIDQPSVLEGFLPMCGRGYMIDCDCGFAKVIKEITETYRNRHNLEAELHNMTLLKEEYQRQARELRG